MLFAAQGQVLLESFGWRHKDPIKVILDVGGHDTVALF